MVKKDLTIEENVTTLANQTCIKGKQITIPITCILPRKHRTHGKTPETLGGRNSPTFKGGGVDGE